MENIEEDAYPLGIPAVEYIKEIYGYHKELKHVCSQILLLNNTIAEQKVRFDRAVDQDRREFLLLIKHKIETVQAVRDMFEHYLSEKAEMIEVMMKKLEEVTGIVYSTYLAEHAAVQDQHSVSDSESQSEDEDSEMDISI